MNQQSALSDALSKIVGIFIIGLVAWFLFGRGDTSSTKASDATPEPTVAKHLSGEFVEWQPVDEKNGYALFTVTNNGSSAATAECTVKVDNDFGNFGFDIMTGETIPAGQTKNYRMPLSVGEGSFLIDHGEVTDC